MSWRRWGLERGIAVFLPLPDAQAEAVGLAVAVGLVFRDRPGCDVNQQILLVYVGRATDRLTRVPFRSVAGARDERSKIALTVASDVVREII